MHADSQVLGTTRCAKVDCPNVCVEQTFMVNPSLFHIVYHFITAKITECRIVNLNISWAGQCISAPVSGTRKYWRQPASYNSAISARYAPPRSSKYSSTGKKSQRTGGGNYQVETLPSFLYTDRSYVNSDPCRWWYQEGEHIVILINWTSCRIVSLCTSKRNSSYCFWHQRFEKTKILQIEWCRAFDFSLQQDLST